jgi:hypothetical protein
MAKQKPKEPKVRIVDHALVDEAGQRWEFDFATGWRTDVAELISDVRPLRILAGHYADTRELSSDALGQIDTDAEGGVYRSHAGSIVYILE